MPHRRERDNARRRQTHTSADTQARTHTHSPTMGDTYFFFRTVNEQRRRKAGGEKRAKKCVYYVCTLHGQWLWKKRRRRHEFTIDGRRRHARACATGRRSSSSSFTVYVYVKPAESVRRRNKISYYPRVAGLTVLGMDNLDKRHPRLDHWTYRQHSREREHRPDVSASSTRFPGPGDTARGLGRSGRRRRDVRRRSLSSTRRRTPKQDVLFRLSRRSFFGRSVPLLRSSYRDGVAGRSWARTRNAVTPNAGGQPSAHGQCREKRCLSDVVERWSRCADNGHFRRYQRLSTRSRRRGDRDSGRRGTRIAAMGRGARSRLRRRRRRRPPRYRSAFGHLKSRPRVCGVWTVRRVGRVVVDVVLVVVVVVVYHGWQRTCVRVTRPKTLALRDNGFRFRLSPSNFSAFALTL